MKNIKTGSDHLNKYDKETMKRKASTKLLTRINKEKGQQAKKEDLKHSFIKQFQKRSEKV